MYLSVKSPELQDFSLVRFLYLTYVTKSEKY